jgi:hypothetical protein
LFGQWRNGAILACLQKIREPDDLRSSKAMATADRQKKEARATPNGGAEAPEIVLPVGPAESWALRDFRGKPVVLIFYPADWEPVSTDQLTRYNEIVPQIHALGAELVGISVDSMWCHQAFAKALRLGFRLLSDACPRAPPRGPMACTGPVKLRVSARSS